MGRDYTWVRGRAKPVAAVAKRSHRYPERSLLPCLGSAAFRDGKNIYIKIQ
jgi:hypothetical protein